MPWLCTGEMWFQAGSESVGVDGNLKDHHTEVMEETETRSKGAEEPGRKPPGVKEGQVAETVGGHSPARLACEAKLLGRPVSRNVVLWLLYSSTTARFYAQSHPVPQVDGHIHVKGLTPDRSNCLSKVVSLS